MANLGNFDANNVEPRAEFEPIPNGKYLAQIVDSEVKDSQKGGRYLKLTWEILEGEHKGRKLWWILNLYNQSEKAVQIAQAELSTICRATGVMKPKDSQDLHHIPALISVKCVKDNRDGVDEMKNEIKGCYSKSEAQAKQPAPSTSGGGNAAPWKR